MEMEISSNEQFFKLYSRGREAKNWDSIGAFDLSIDARDLPSPDHTGGVHNAFMTPT